MKSCKTPPQVLLYSKQHLFSNYWYTKICMKMETILHHVTPHGLVILNTIHKTWVFFSAFIKNTTVVYFNSTFLAKKQRKICSGIGKGLAMHFITIIILIHCFTSVSSYQCQYHMKELKYLDTIFIYKWTTL